MTVTAITVNGGPALECRREEGAPMTEAPAAASSAWDWLPAQLWTCPKCCAVYLVRELGPRCRRCGYVEDGA